jgi:hypothetical protein
VRRICVRVGQQPSETSENPSLSAWYRPCSVVDMATYEGGQDIRNRAFDYAWAQALVGEASQLIAIVTTIVKNKRRNVAAKRAADKAAKAAKAAKQTPS